MPDREKVIKGLECCTRFEVGKQLNNCLDCPYIEPIGFNHFRCKIQEMKKDALAMLKEQQKEIDEIADEYIDIGKEMAKQPQIVRCKDCKKRPTSSCVCALRKYDDNFYCADGEKR